ncbi:MAG TPA: YraN family protein [Chloroflexia bacterium]|nr:YraN family protein [Chloroflexia bacterium]
MSTRQALGRAGEARAAAYLQAQGLTIRETGWRPTGTALAPLLRGELDLVALDGATLVFVEVRSRRGAPGAAEESVTPAKRRQLLALAQAYLVTHDLTDDQVAWRVDVVALHFGAGRPTPTITWLPGAVEAEDGA